MPPPLPASSSWTIRWWPLSHEGCARTWYCQVSDIDDPVQESLLVISRKVKGLKAAAFSSWLFTVIKPECRMLERAMFHHLPLPGELAEAQLASRPRTGARIHAGSRHLGQHLALEW